MTQPREWIAKLLDAHTSGLDDLARAQAQIRHLAAILDLLVETLEQVGITQRAFVQSHVEYMIAAHRLEAARAMSMPQFTSQASPPTPHAAHHPLPQAVVAHHNDHLEPWEAAHSHDRQALNGARGNAHEQGAPPVSDATQPAAPAPAPKPSRKMAAIPQISAPANAPPLPRIPTQVPGPAQSGSAFVSCAICRKNVQRVSTNLIDGVGDVCDACVGAT